MRPHPIVVSLSALAFVLGALAMPGPAAARSAAHGSRIVLSPHRGQVVHSHKIRLRVRARSVPGALRVRLNGRRIEKGFGLPRHGVRTLRASISHGLGRGRNVLRVRARRRDGSIRTATVRFRVRTSDPLVGAGRDIRIAVGQTAQLNGRIARARRSSAKRPIAFTGSHPPLRWRLVHHPHHSRARAVTGARGNARAQLSSPAGLNAGLKPSIPGHYTLQLTSGRGPGATSDRVTVSAVPPSPLVELDTAAGSAGKPGIKIGSTVYPADASKGQGAVQVLVLNRQTLDSPSNTTYAFRDPKLAADVARLDSSKFVVAAQINPGSDRSGGVLNEALASIGVPKGPYFNVAIGVPGMKAGDADVGDSANGGLKGYLTPDQYLNYGFVAARRVPFSYPPNPQPPCKPGGTKPCDSRAGFEIHVQDAWDLHPLAHDGSFYNTNGRDLPNAQRGAEADRMAADLNDIDSRAPGAVVTIETVTTRFDGEDHYRAPVGAISGDSMNRLAAAVASVGGTRDGFNQVATKGGVPESGGHVYTLVGWSGAGEGNGAEAAAGINGAPNAPTLSGVLRPDRQSRFRPESVSTQSGDPDALANMVMRPPSDDWPLDDKPGTRKAIDYLGTAVGLGPNPRLAYWTADWTQSTTNHLIDLIEHESYPGAQAGFSSADFDAAGDELRKELGWVGTVRQYMHDLARPFADNQLTSWTQAHNIADDIYEATKKPDDETVYRWLDFTKILLELAGPFTHDVSGEIGSLMDLGMWIAGATEGGAPTYDDLAIKADKLGEQLVDQAAQTATTYDRMAQIIVSDPVKLKYFGSNGGCDPVSNPKCPPELAWGTAQRVQASASVYRGIERTIYQKLMPLGYRIDQLMPSNRGGLRPGIGYNWIKRWQPPNIANYVCTPNSWSVPYHPWSYYSSGTAAATSLVTQFDPSDGSSVYTTYVMTEIPAASWQHGEEPPKELLKRMFDPLPQSNDPKAGGLGISPQAFMSGTPVHYWEDTLQKEIDRCIWDG